MEEDQTSSTKQTSNKQPTMINFKAIALAATVALGTTLGATAPAQAAQCDHVEGTGYIRCVTNNGHGRYDYMTYHHSNQIVAELHVLCTGGNGYKWDATWSNDFFNRTYVDAAAKGWCSGY